MIKNFVFLFLITLLIISCKSKSEVKQDKQLIENKKNEQVIKKENIPKEYYTVEISTINDNSEIIFNSQNKGKTPLKLELEKGIYDITLSRKDYPDQICRLEVNSNKTFLFRHNKNKIPIKQVGIFECGNQPKQVLFSPDDKYIFLPLLEDDGFQIFDMQELKMIKYIIPPDPKHKKGFAEGLFVKEKNLFFVSQMNTGLIYEYSYPDLNFLKNIKTDGIWPKFIAWSPVLQVCAVSNWASNMVSIFDAQTGNIIKKINTANSPRGLTFTNDGKYLFITSFDGGKIQKIETEKWKEVKNIYKTNAAMRHIVLNNDNSKAYVSNMYHNQIYEIDINKFTIDYTYKVFDNPNTIDLTPDNNYLFVSSRGPNNPKSYLDRSLVNGKITAINVEKKEKSFIIDGGNQPTGLDVSNNGNYLCFSNFRDKNIEIYWIGDLNGNK